MNPDLVEIYKFLFKELSEKGLMGYPVNIRVEEGIYIKVYINDEGGKNGTFKKPLMIVYFSAPGILTVKFIAMINIAKLSENYRLIPLEGYSYRVDFDNPDNFKEFVKMIV